MQQNTGTLTRKRLRNALRSPVGVWKQWREAMICRPFKHPLAVCAIFREEALFLDEWLTFHAGVGATHFYLYNNFSTDDFQRILHPWIKAGFVTLTDWPVDVGQLPAYQDCLRRFSSEARWIAFIDVDEFLFAPGTGDILPVLNSFAHLPGIEVWQIFFGANGHVKRPSASVIDSYTKCSPDRETTVKTIANPRLVYRAGVHQCKYWNGTSRDTSLQVAGPGAIPVFDRLRINHYWSRSIEDLNTKVRRGDASTAAKRDHDWHLQFESGLNKQPDLTIQAVARNIRRPFAS